MPAVAGVELGLSTPKGGTQTQGMEVRGPRKTRAGVGTVGRDCLGTEDIFKKPALKYTTEFT